MTVSGNIYVSLLTESLLYANVLYFVISLTFNFQFCFILVEARNEFKEYVNLLATIRNYEVSNVEIVAF